MTTLTRNDVKSISEIATDFIRTVIVFKKDLLWDKNLKDNLNQYFTTATRYIPKLAKETDLRSTTGNNNVATIYKVLAPLYQEEAVALLNKDNKDNLYEHAVTVATYMILMFIRDHHIKFFDFCFEKFDMDFDSLSNAFKYSKIPDSRKVAYAIEEILETRMQDLF